MNTSRGNQFSVIQGNHSPEDAIPLGNGVLQYTVKCHPLSVNNLLVGVNEPASDSNLLQPGESMRLGVIGYGNIDQLYLDFDTTGGTSGGRALVIVERDSGKEFCLPEQA